MGLSSLPAPSEGVLSIVLVNTALSIATFKEIVRSILHVAGIRSSQSPDESDSPPDSFDSSPLVDELQCRVPAIRFGSFYRCPTELDCSVCLTRFESESEINRLPCGHFFHKACLDKWLGYWKVTCPNCRTSLLPPAEEATASGSASPWF